MSDISLDEIDKIQFYPLQHLIEIKSKDKHLIISDTSSLSLYIIYKYIPFEKYITSLYENRSHITKLLKYLDNDEKKNFVSKLILLETLRICSK